ncbi:Arc family DNA-binding protein [Delftia sp. WSY_7]|uniref:Arc family DNA-binding protein n=1 Tax=Delftia sp. WSY_7 TaxID=3367202 RepID=UPI00370A2310
MAQSEVQTNVRLPAALKTWLQEQAETARRSLTAEVVHRLEESRARQEKGTNQ